MNYLDKEDRIIDLFQDSAFQDAIFVGASRDALSVYGAVHNRTKWRNWTNSSGKSDPPPDYFSKTYGLMMDVMRTDDHTRLNKYGKAVNPTNQKEAQIQKELAENGFLDMFPHVDGVLVNAVTDLPSREDHNYQFYYSAFQRVIQKHIASIPLYKKNHPDCKVVFFIMDESSGYVQATDKRLARRGTKHGESFLFEPYNQFLDRRFVASFMNADIDYLIWYAPYKRFDSNLPTPPPSVCVYDVKRINPNELIDYPEEMIISTEE